jgi:hypothetical protein
VSRCVDKAGGTGVFPFREMEGYPAVYPTVETPRGASPPRCRSAPPWDRWRLAGIIKKNGPKARLSSQQRPVLL